MDIESITVEPWTDGTLPDGCYEKMFKNCSSLKTVPTLSATNLAEFCYVGIFANCGKISSITMLAPSSEISGNSDCVLNWLMYAGIDGSVTSRTLKVKDKAAYEALVIEGLDENWKIGKCTVLDENGNEITNE